MRLILIFALITFVHSKDLNNTKIVFWEDGNEYLYRESIQYNPVSPRSCDYRRVAYNLLETSKNEYLVFYFCKNKDHKEVRKITRSLKRPAAELTTRSSILNIARYVSGE
ncbi:ORF5 [Lodeiro virus]|uniref:ORF5 n=1 Tax=Lodeiro virus TaxID=1911102 RepID=UPI0008DB3CA4|nr:ORF5 [Lodeiro virus]AOY34457.1 ORF5 [Lodeiro virus]